MSGAEPAGDPPRTPHIDPLLDDVAVSSPAYSQAASRLDQARSALEADEARLAETSRRITTLGGERDRLTSRITDDTAIKQAADSEIATLSTQLRGLALAAYVGGSDQAEQQAVYTLDDSAFLRARSSTTLREAVLGTTHARYEQELARSEAAGQRLAENRASLARTQEGLARAAADAESAAAAIERDRAAIVEGLVAVRDTRAVAQVDGTDLPLVALDAYLHGARIARLRTPGCHLHWSLLAGIGKVESGQGTHGGASLRGDGTLTRPIFGIPLNGDHGTETIRTGDGAYMRAEGPMQFLPSTWASVAVDGDDDEQVDIQNLYDAAASAGAYLCRGGVDTATEDGRRRAILSYNFSGAYVSDVIREMRRYAEALPDLDTG